MSPTLRPPEEVRLKRTAMSTRELRRAEVLGRVKGHTLRLVDAAKMLELSYRQAKRLWQRYRDEGAKGLQHRSAGRSSNRAKPGKFRRKVLQLIREKYSGTEQERFGPTLAAEHLADEDGLEVGEETLRRWMLAEGLWSRIRRRKAHRKRRERRPYFGDLVQLDGSFHRCCHRRSLRSRWRRSRRFSRPRPAARRTRSPGLPVRFQRLRFLRYGRGRPGTQDHRQRRLPRHFLL